MMNPVSAQKWEPSETERTAFNPTVIVAEISRNYVTRETTV